jgi:phage host-nuclease inhibitor protein Gam
MSIEERLNDMLADDTQPDGFGTETFTVTTEDQAAWASRKLNAAYAEQARIKAWAAREHDRINAIVERELKSPQSTIDYMTSLLHAWFNQLLNAGRRTKSIDLPGGRFGVRKTAARLDVTDEPQVIKWLEDVDALDVLRVKRSIDKKALARRVKVIEGTPVDIVTGEVIPFISTHPESENPYFTPEEQS